MTTKIKELPTLPSWARYDTDPDKKGHARFEGERVCVIVDGDDAYPSVMAEYRAMIEGGSPLAAPEYEVELAALRVGEPCKYMTAVIRHTIQVDVWRVTGPKVRLNIQSSPEGKDRWALRNRPDGIDVARAAGDGKGGGRLETRVWYKALRGFYPA